MTPSAATCAIARSMNTMPRSSTCMPSGTWVAVTSSPAMSAGHRMPHSAASMITERSLIHGEQALDRVVEQPEQVLRLRRAADSEGQRHDRNVRPLRKELRRARIVVRRIDHRLRRTALHSLYKLSEMRRRWRNAGLGLQAARFAHPRPVDEVGHVLMVNNDRHALERLRLLAPLLYRLVPALVEVFGARAIRRSIRLVDLRQPLGHHLGHLGDVARIEVDVRVAGRMDIPHCAIDHLRDLQPDDVLRGLDEPWRAGLDAIVARLCKEQWQPTNLEF